jgi:hypothetical protein
MSAGPNKRLNVLQSHLTENTFISEDAPFLETLDCHASGGCNETDHSYCVVLPENLTPQGPWLVRRSVSFFDQQKETIPLVLFYFTFLQQVL